MKFLGLDISKAPKYPKGAIGAVAVGQPGGGSFIREGNTGDWQKYTPSNTRDSMMASSVPYACTDLISSDVAKLKINYVKRKKKVWREAKGPRYVKLLCNPNPYQTRDQFIKAWVSSKISWGNAYILLTRNVAGTIVQMDALNPRYVVPLVAPDQSVFYQITMSPLQVTPLESNVVPASEIIHDRGMCLKHPLVGVSPLSACAAAVSMTASMTDNSAAFFANSARPSGVLTAPGKISQTTADEIKAYWAKNFSGNSSGKLAVLGDDLKYAAMTMSSTDAQLIEQLNFSVADIARCFHVPLHKIGADQMRTAGTSNAVYEAAYYSDCLQSYIEAIEMLLTSAFDLPSDRGIQFDLSGLMRMDEGAMITANAASVKAGIMAPNEARAKQGLKPKKGGNTPYLQMQNYALSALAARDKAGAPNTPVPMPDGTGVGPNGEPLPAAAPPVTEPSKPVTPPAEKPAK